MLQPILCPESPQFIFHPQQNSIIFVIFCLMGNKIHHFCNIEEPELIRRSMRLNEWRDKSLYRLWYKEKKDGDNKVKQEPNAD